jgi:DNA polymerase III subunit delta'
LALPAASGAYSGVPIVPLFGHEALRERLLEASRAGRLPSSLLLHGAPGIGKQRLALWLARALLCEGADSPCGKCQGCRYANVLAHPDLHWIFPRPRLKDSDPSLDDVRADYGEAIAERVAAHGLYARPSGSEGIYVSSVRSIVHRAGISPALGRRKVFIVGDAERMVPQEGADMAANAFLKLLEEPPADTTLILTSSEPGALLPTVRSRVVTLRMSPLAERDVRAFLSDPLVRETLADEPIPKGEADRIQLADGAPGSLLSGADRAQAREQAKRFLAVVESRDRAAALKTAFVQGATKSRGRFTDTLEALASLLHDRARASAERGDARAAIAAAKGVDAVYRAMEHAAGNVSPNLVSARLFADLGTDA